MVRGQFRGYRDEPDVAKDSYMATYATLRLWVDSWRWEGVPASRHSRSVTRGRSLLRSQAARSGPADSRPHPPSPLYSLSRRKIWPWST